MLDAAGAYGGFAESKVWFYKCTVIHLWRSIDLIYGLFSHPHLTDSFQSLYPRKKIMKQTYTWIIGGFYKYVCLYSRVTKRTGMDKSFGCL